MFILGKLDETGLIVKSIVSDVGSSNQKMVSALEITESKPYFRFKDRKIYFFFDPPHLLKCMRNNLKVHNLMVRNGEIVSWVFIYQFFFLQDFQNELRLAPKLTAKHFIENDFQKMKVQLAAQVFSHTVAASMNTYVALNKLDKSAEPTIRFIIFINRLVDFFQLQLRKRSK